MRATFLSLEGCLLPAFGWACKYMSGYSRGVGMRVGKLEGKAWLVFYSDVGLGHDPAGSLKEAGRSLDGTEVLIPLWWVLQSLR